MIWKMVRFCLSTRNCSEDLYDVAHYYAVFVNLMYMYVKFFMAVFFICTDEWKKDYHHFSGMSACTDIRHFQNNFDIIEEPNSCSSQ